MNNERFNQLLNGPLSHPMMPFAIMRLAQALWYVVEVTGEAGGKALEEWCQLREDDDNAGEDDEHDGSDEMLDLDADGELGGES